MLVLRVVLPGLSSEEVPARAWHETSLRISATHFTDKLHVMAIAAAEKAEMHRKCTRRFLSASYTPLDTPRSFFSSSTTKTTALATKQQTKQRPRHFAGYQREHKLITNKTHHHFHTLSSNWPTFPKTWSTISECPPTPPSSNSNATLSRTHGVEWGPTPWLHASHKLLLEQHFATKHRNLIVRCGWALTPLYQVDY